MLKNFLDTIIAPITGMQKAAVAVLRLSGPEAFKISSKIFGNWPSVPESHKAVYGHFLNGDDGLVLPFAQGRSYTGQESVEMSIHGSPASVKSLIQLACKHGARLAGPGEFTQRAFINGRIDLTRAEGVLDSVNALTEAQFKAATELRKGKFYRQICDLRREAEGILVAVEASVDFSEEIGDLDREGSIEKMDQILQELEKLLKISGSAKILREGLRIALVGLPNAGKSSILNAFLGTDRAIVTEIAGTTRDTVEELVDIGGVPCILIDTAGLRQTEDLVERLGVERSYQAAASADLVWYIYDAAAGWQFQDQELLEALPKNSLILANKIDLNLNFDCGNRGIGISAKTHEGFDVLITEIQKSSEMTTSVPRVALNARHAGLLEEAREALLDVRHTLESGLPEDLASVGLSKSLYCLGDITGQNTPPDIIDRIFHDFCIGK